MTVKASDMLRDVRVAIDMNRVDAPLIAEADPDTLSLDDVIRAKLPDALRLVCMEAPLRMLESGHDFGDQPLFWDADMGGRFPNRPVPSHDCVAVEGRFASAPVPSLSSGFIILPSDFLRLVCFRMSDWERPVFEAISETDARYAMQHSRFGGIRGNTEKPVAAIVRRAEGLALEFFSCRSRDAFPVQADYIPEPRIDPDGGIDVPRLCYRPAVYRAASLALASLGDQLSSTLLQISKSLLQ